MPFSVSSTDVAMPVVNWRVGENSLVPAAFDALTRQKCNVLFCKPTTVEEVSANPDWSATVELKSAAVEIWRWYEEALNAGLQINVSVVGWFVAPSAGERSVGAAGGVIVVNDPTEENALVAPALRARTRQKYVVPDARGPTVFDVPLTDVSSVTILTKVETVES